MLDTLEQIETPEGVQLSLRPAGPLPRAIAWLIDLLIKLAIIFAVVMLIAGLGEFFVGVTLLIIFVILWGYNVLFEVFNRGATPGKRALGLQVVRANGAPVGWAGSILRNFLRVVDFLPSLYVLGLFASLTNSRFQRLGDIAAGTVVAHRDASALPPALQTNADAQPLRVPLSRDEQRAVMQFGERSGMLSGERCVELASILSPVTGVDGVLAVERLRAHANWLAGRT